MNVPYFCEARGVPKEYAPRGVLPSPALVFPVPCRPRRMSYETAMVFASQAYNRWALVSAQTSADWLRAQPSGTDDGSVAAISSDETSSHIRSSRAQGFERSSIT